MTGYDQKTIRLSHNAATPVQFTLEIDVAGDGRWAAYRRFVVEPGQTVEHEFPAGFHPYWVRTIVDRPCRATAMLEYE